MPFLFFEIPMPYFMRSLAQKVPLTGTAEAGTASVTVCSEDAPRIPPELQGSWTQPCGRDITIQKSVGDRFPVR